MRKLVLDTFIPYRLSIASNAVSDLISRAYRSYFHLTVPEWRLIAVLAERKEATQMELGKATHMDKVTVSRSAIALAKRGLITRRSNLSDKRSQLLSLSVAGRELYDQVVPQALFLEEAVLSSFSAGERETLMSMLRRMQVAAEEALARKLGDVRARGSIDTREADKRS